MMTVIDVLRVVVDKVAVVVGNDCRCNPPLNRRVDSPPCIPHPCAALFKSKSITTIPVGK